MVSSQNSAPVKLVNIQALRGLAAVLVMISHLYVIDQKYSGDPILPYALNFGMVGVDLFFVISGFIMVYITQSYRSASGKRIPEFLFARAARIYPIYWLVSAALLVVYLLRPDWVFASTGYKPELVKSFLLFPGKAAPLLEVGWTLVHEMGFYIVFALLLFLPASLRLWGLVLWAIAVVVGNHMGLGELSYVTALLFHPLSLEFLLGAFMAWMYLKSEPRFAKTALVLGTALAVISAAYWLTQETGAFPLGWRRIGLFALPAALITYGFVALERSGHYAPQWAARIGDWSYSLYLTHVLSLSVIGRVWQMVAQPGAWDNIIVAVLASIAAIFAAWMTYELAEKPMLLGAKKLRRKLFARD